MNKPRLIIADDQEPQRFMFRVLLEHDCEVVGEAENGREAVEAVDRLHPDILLMDISMPLMGGFEAARIIRENMPEVRVVLITQHAQRGYAEEALRMGIKGYILKARANSDLVNGMRQIIAGHAFCSDGVR